MYLRIETNTTRFERWDPGPGLWEKGPQRQRGVVEQRDQNRDPAAPKDADQAQPRGTALAPLAGQGVGHIEPRTLVDRLLGQGHRR